MFTAIRDVCPGLFRQCLSPLCLLCCYPLHVLAFFPILTPDLVNSRCPYSLSFINFSSLRYSLSFCRSRYTVGFVIISFTFVTLQDITVHLLCPFRFLRFSRHKFSRIISSSFDLVDKSLQPDCLRLSIYRMNLESRQLRVSGLLFSREYLKLY